MSAGAAKPAVVDLAEAVKGVMLVGPLPRELQKVTNYSAGLAARTAAPEAAKAFVAFLASPPARSKFIAVGLQ